VKGAATILTANATLILASDPDALPRIFSLIYKQIVEVPVGKRPAGKRPEPSKDDPSLLRSSTSRESHGTSGEITNRTTLGSVSFWPSADNRHGRWETRETKIIRLNAEETERQIPSASFFSVRTHLRRSHSNPHQSKNLRVLLRRGVFPGNRKKNRVLTTQVSDALIRRYWSIENNLHGHRDVQLGEIDLSSMSPHSSRIIGSIFDVMQSRSQFRR